MLILSVLIQLLELAYLFMFWVLVSLVLCWSVRSLFFSCLHTYILPSRSIGMTLWDLATLNKPIMLSYVIYQCPTRLYFCWTVIIFYCWCGFHSFFCLFFDIMTVWKRIRVWRPSQASRQAFTFNATIKRWRACCYITGFYFFSIWAPFESKTKEN